MALDRSELQQCFERDQIQFLLVQFVDMHGAAKTKMVPAACLDDVLDVGAGFAGGALWGAGQGPHSHDMLARIDPNTYTRLPWQPNTARFASNLFVDDKEHPYCCRTNLSRVLAAAQSRGYIFNVGMEPEFFLVTRAADGTIQKWDPEGVDRLAKPCYDFRSMAPAMDFLQELTNSLNGLGWGVYQVDHEDANSQFEVNFSYADALTTADRITFFKMAVAQIANKYGAIATHMPKPFADQTGSGLHVHFHLADAKTGKNLFLNESDSRGLGLSQIAYHFLAGVIAHARGAMCRHKPDGQLLQASQAGTGTLLNPVRFQLDARFRRLWRQQPHANDPSRRPGPLRRPHGVGRLQSVSRTGRHAVGGTRRHRAPARSGTAEPWQHVRAVPRRDSRGRNPLAASVSPRGDWRAESRMKSSAGP